MRFPPTRLPTTTAGALGGPGSDTSAVVVVVVVVNRTLDDPASRAARMTASGLMSELDTLTTVAVSILANTSVNFCCFVFPGSVTKMFLCLDIEFINKSVVNFDRTRAVGGRGVWRLLGTQNAATSPQTQDNDHGTVQRPSRFSTSE